MGDGPAQYCKAVTPGEAVAASTASPGSPCMPPFFVALNHGPSSTRRRRGRRRRKAHPPLTSALRRYRAARPPPAPPRFPSTSRANPLAARAAALSGSMPMMASKSSMALSNRATYMRAIPRL